LVFERTFITFGENISMRSSLFLKIFFVLPAILFADYILISIIGCTTCLFGAGDDFYCGPFCVAGKIILGISALFFGYLVYPELRQLLNSKSDKHSE
jgi:hypothetical protein